MRKSRVLSFLLGSLIIISVIIALIFRNNASNDIYIYGVKINKWDNVYSGENIKFYYMNKENENLSKLKSKYGIEKIIEGNKNDLEKTMLIINWLNKKFEVRASAMKSKKTTEKLLQEVETNKVIAVSDFNNILEDTLTSIGITCRIGQFRGISNSKSIDESEYEVLEVWSDAHGKWIMIDSVLGSYLIKDDIPISATEMLISDSNNLKMQNSINIKNYFKNISKYLETYTIKINNDKYEKNNSNSLITLVKSMDDIQIEAPNGFIQPTIFVVNSKIFDASPKIVHHNDESEEVPTIILAKKNLKEDTKDYTKFTVGAFMNSYMLDKYYISINGKEYRQVKRYYDLSLPSGITTLSLSLDGKNELRKIEFEANLD